MSLATHTTASRTITARHVLMFDAGTCVAMGLLLLTAAGPLSGLLGLPQSFISMSGLVLLPCAAFIAFATRVGDGATPPAPLVWAVILGNVAWIAGSICTVAVWFSATAAGVAFVVLQAVAVAVLTVMEYRGLRA